MDTSLLPIVGNLGVAGFAIWIMWKMFDSNTRERDKHLGSSQIEREKYMGLITETQKSFDIYQQKVQDDILGQLHKNTDALTRVLDHFTHEH